MYRDRKKHPLRWIIPVLAGVILVAAIVLITQTAVRKDMRTEEAAAIQRTIEEHARQCYAVEGNYPASLSYLEEHYGVRVNQRDFYVVYEAFASNLPPTVRVIAKER